MHAQCMWVLLAAWLFNIIYYVLSLSVMQAGVTCISFSNYTAWKWQPEKKNHDLVPELAAYTLTWSSSYAIHHCVRDYPSPITVRIYTVTGGPQYCDHLRPVPEGSVRWYAQRASSMCTCMSTRASWKMVHCSYLCMLSLSVGCEFRRQVVVLSLRLPVSSFVVRKAYTSYTSLHNT